MNTENDNKKNGNLPISDVIASASFKDAIKRAIEFGKGSDWGYDGENEYEYDTFDSEESLEEVITVIKEYLL